MGIWTMVLVVTVIVLAITVTSVTVRWSRVLVHLLRATAVLLRASTVIGWPHVIYFMFRVSIRFLRISYDLGDLIDIL
jgi:hypothetical protein